MDSQIGELKEREKLVKDQFVYAYRITLDYEMAAWEIGFRDNFAKEMATKFRYDPYVIEAIATLVASGELENDEIWEERKRRVWAGLYREANFYGDNASHSARVNALSKKAAILGMDAPIRTESKVTHAGLIKHDVAIDHSKFTPEQLVHYRALVESQLKADDYQ